MLRVVGSDPGTSSLDLLLLQDGSVVDQRSYQPGDLAADPNLISQLFTTWAPIDLAAAPSGYGLPLVRGDAFAEDHIEQMSLVKPADRGHDSGVIGFRAWVRAFLRSGVSIIFLPGGLHLPTIPPHRKVNSVDLGTADKVCVAALARLVRFSRLRRLRTFDFRCARDRHSLFGDPGRRKRPARRRLRWHPGPDRSSITRMLGRRGRLLAHAR